MAFLTVSPLSFPELRKDPIIDRWVIVSTERAGRPIETAAAVAPLSASAYCPFCEGNEADTPGELLAFRHSGTKVDAPGWWVRVVPNRFPAVRLPDDPGMLEFSGPPLRMLAGGSHEVFIECPQHIRDFSDLPHAALCEVFEAYRQRLAYWRADGHYRYAQLFKNVGPMAGASLAHSHAQLIVMPLVPYDVRAELDAALRHHHQTGRCIFCDLIEFERSRERCIVETRHFLAIAPFASRFSFEVWILPKTHGPHYDAITESARDELASLVQDLLRRLQTGQNAPDYNIVLHTAPFHQPGSEPYHWHLEILPRMSQAAGFEWGTGFAINPVPPEQAAAFYRAVTFAAAR